MSMPEAERDLRNLFAMDEPPAEDDLFVLSVMQRIERRATRAETATLVLTVAMATAAVLLYGRELAPMVESMIGLAWPALLALAAGWLAISPWPWRLLAELTDDRLAS